MARIRSVHPDAMKSEKLAACSAEAERCYWRLLPHCDDDGRAEDHPKLLAAYMFPLVDDADEYAVDIWLSELDALGLLIRFTVEGRRYLEVTRWCEYQKPQKKQPSKLPPADSGTRTVGLRDEFGSGSVAVEHGGEGSGGESLRGLVDTAIDILAERDMKKVENIRNERAVFSACRQSRVLDSKAALVKLSHQHRDWTADQLADAIAPVEPEADLWDFSAKAPVDPCDGMSEEDRYSFELDKFGQAVADRKRELRESERLAALELQ